MNKLEKVKKAYLPGDVVKLKDYGSSFTAVITGVCECQYEMWQYSVIPITWKGEEPSGAWHDHSDITLITPIPKPHSTKLRHLLKKHGRLE